jgi:hypothetical protein
MPERFSVHFTFPTEEELVVYDQPQEAFVQIQFGTPSGQTAFFNGKLGREKLTFVGPDQRKQVHEFLLGLLICLRSKEMMPTIFKPPFD